MCICLPMRRNCSQLHASISVSRIFMFRFLFQWIIDIIFPYRTNYRQFREESFSILTHKQNTTHTLFIVQNLRKVTVFSSFCSETMGTEVINVSYLQEELDKAKSTLKGLNDNIRRISGREPPEQLRLVYYFFHRFYQNSLINGNYIVSFRMA